MWAYSHADTATQASFILLNAAQPENKLIYRLTGGQYRNCQHSVWHCQTRWHPWLLQGTRLPCAVKTEGYRSGSSRQKKRGQVLCSVDRLVCALSPVLFGRVDAVTASEPVLWVYRHTLFALTFLQWCRHTLCQRSEITGLKDSRNMWQNYIQEAGVQAAHALT